MWKIFITYGDESKVTITGGHRDIPMELAWKYYNQYVNRKRDNAVYAVYQQYPKKDHAPMELMEKIEKLEKGEVE